MTDKSPLDIAPIVDRNWLASHFSQVVLADVRWYLDGRSGYDAFLAGHVPGAIWIDLDHVLSNPPDAASGRHPFPTPEEFAHRLGEVGIADDDTVIAYDDHGGAYAARLAWMLRRIGQAATILDGGLPSWDQQLETGARTRPPRQRAVKPWPAELIRSTADIEAAITTDALILDARSFDRYSGEELLPGEPRAGHVPRARSAPWQANLGSDGRFLDPNTLRSRYEQLGVADAVEVVAYCGSGVTACHDLLAIEYAGFSDAALYVGSWSAWSIDDSLPIVSEQSPGPRPPFA
jgi:thiosulfate/3-mercaptopyruvate sulfurtransferase